MTLSQVEPPPDLIGSRLLATGKPPASLTSLSLMNTNSTFQDPDSDLTVMILSMGPEEPGEVLPWVNNPDWRPSTEADKGNN